MCPVHLDVHKTDEVIVLGKWHSAACAIPGYAWLPAWGPAAWGPPVWGPLVWEPPVWKPPAWGPPACLGTTCLGITGKDVIDDHKMQSVPVVCA